MADSFNNQFHADRLDGFDRILKLVKAHIDALQPKLIIDLQALSPTAIRQSAEKEVWQLLHNGILHLKEGAPQGQPGSMSGALTKASLRSSSLAASLGVKPPQFEAIILPADYTSGYDAAAFLSAWLIDAARRDCEKSRDKIEQKIVGEDMHAAFGHTDEMDPSLKKIFDTVKKGAGIDIPSQPLDKVSIEDIGNFRRQLITSYNMAAAAYPACCDTLLQEIENLPPPPSPEKKPKGGRFDL